MAKQKKSSNKKRENETGSSFSKITIDPRTQRVIFAIVAATCLFIVVMGYAGYAGLVGGIVAKVSHFIFGWGMWFVPVLLGGFIFRALSSPQKFYAVYGIGSLLSFIALSGVLAIFDDGKMRGGMLGKIVSIPFLNLFGPWASFVILFAVFAVGFLLVFGIPPFSKKKEKAGYEEEESEGGPVFAGKAPTGSLVRRIFLGPRFRAKEIAGPSSLPLLEGRSIQKPKAESVRASSFEEVLREQEEKVEKGSAKSASASDKIAQQEGKDTEEKKAGIPYTFPPFELLEEDSGRPTVGDIRANASIIKRTLQNFDINVEMGEVNTGPTVTQYTLKPAEGIKLARITALNNDLSLALASHPIRIEAPIPGRSLVGIEIPNRGRTLVRLRNLIQNPEFINSSSPLTFCLGRDVAGNSIFADLGRMPHLLIAGSTGTGKTICLNSILLSLIYRNSPETLRFILIDPKRVEFPVFNELPHLLTPAIVDAEATVNALRWATKEMERRFEVLAKSKNRDISLYNEWAQKKGEDIFPFIVIIIDELADLMASRGREVEAGIVRLAQMARAVGIHLVVATQRPSVEVITGLIKANITARIAFQVASQIDSRTILDGAGAEKLLGRGDLLFLSAETGKPKRIQGGYVSEREVKKIVHFITSSSRCTEESETKKEKEDDPPKRSLGESPVYSGQHPIEVKEWEASLEGSMAQEPDDELASSLVEELDKKGDNEFFDSDSSDDEAIYEEARKLIIKTRKASASFLQRRLRLGYARAARIIDMLEERGVVGPGEGAKPRDVYAEEENVE